MKRIRALGFSLAYGDPRYHGRLIANFIYDLRRTPGDWFFQRPTGLLPVADAARAPLLDCLRQVPPPSDRLLTVTTAAAAVETKLWFDTREELPTLVAAGQITTCYNLLRYLARTRQFEADGRFAAAVAPLWKQTLADWIEFQADPAFLRKRMIG